MSLDRKKAKIFSALFLLTFLLAVPFSVAVAANDQSALDADRDGLEDALEAQLGTNPKSSDSDSDGLKRL